ncbi:MAG: helix-turn-helix domain-containing protein [Dysgonamonadaceae bacterium]|jgi:DNA-binding transcriptional MerR regulator|nr:helix-turn-helix domain-containing protein [Dysgonamonadaceae bacterium]
MPRRKLTTINLNELDIYSALIEELRNNPAYSDKDLSTLKLTVLDSYEATIKEIDKAIKHLQHYVVAKKNTIEIFQGEQLINRVRLAKMLGISRQTLTAWINKGFITPLKSNYLPDYETFSTDAVLQELNNYKTEHSEEHI